MYLFFLLCRWRVPGPHAQQSRRSAIHGHRPSNQRRHAQQYHSLSWLERDLCAKWTTLNQTLNFASACTRCGDAWGLRVVCMAIPAHGSVRARLAPSSIEKEAMVRATDHWLRSKIWELSPLVPRVLKDWVLCRSHCQSQHRLQPLPSLPRR